MTDSYLNGGERFNSTQHSYNFNSTNNNIFKQQQQHNQPQTTQHPQMFHNLQNPNYNYFNQETTNYENNFKFNSTKPVFSAGASATITTTNVNPIQNSDISSSSSVSMGYSPQFSFANNYSRLNYAKSNNLLMRTDSNNIEIDSEPAQHKSSCQFIYNSPDTRFLNNTTGKLFYLFI